MEKFKITQLVNKFPALMEVWDVDCELIFCNHCFNTNSVPISVACAWLQYFIRYDRN